ncbi:FMR1-interacting protein NUFIP1-like [Amphiura filiformis]|uniref:FMR1-interacting protein NUFIP1-like n=1 Tax=Amphiura filiformis TaxID=82378 RepID=UPI003B21B54B
MMAYCFPPRGFTAPQAEIKPEQNNSNPNSSQQSVIRHGSFLPPGQSSSSYTFPPNGNNPHQFPPQGPNPQHLNNGYQNPWSGHNRGGHFSHGGQGFRGPGMNNPRHHLAPQYHEGYGFQGQPDHHHGGGRGGGGRGRGKNRKGQNKQQGKKKDQNGNNVKVKENGLKHNCDVCDRGFKTEDLLQVHLSEHVKCTAPGCKFEAHVKVVQLHKKLQHTGKFKVQWLETREEINRWRAERRKNYPTAANMEKKQSEQNRREKSGAVLQTKQFGKMQKSSKKWKGNNNKQHDVPAVNSPSNATEMSMTTSSFQSNESNKRTVKRLGTSEKHDMIPSKQPKVVAPKNEGKMASNTDPFSLFAADDEESDHETDVAIGLQQAEVHLAPSGSIGSLGSLAAAYANDSSEDDKSDDEDVNDAEKEEDKNVQEPSKVIMPAEQQQQPVRPVGRQADRQGRQNSRQRQEGKKRRGNARQQRGKNTGNRYDTRQRKPTLLEMLLAPDIRHERNVLLQCVRYVVSQNFFQESDAR